MVKKIFQCGKVKIDNKSGQLCLLWPFKTFPTGTKGTLTHSRIARSLTWKVRECFEDDEDELRLDVVLEVLESLGSSNVEKRNEEEVLALVQ